MNLSPKMVLAKSLLEVVPDFIDHCVLGRAGTATHETSRNLPIEISLEHLLSGGLIEHDHAQRDIIVVTKNASNLADKFHLTLTFTDKGECRLKVDGKGEYLRWQVSRKSLEEIFFYGLFEK